MVEISLGSWRQREGHEGVRDAWAASRDLLAAHAMHSFPGRCGLCGSDEGFVLSESAIHDQPDLREGLLCVACRHNARVRAGLRLLLDGVGSLVQPQVYLTEQVTPAFIWLQRHLRGHLHGSEYEPDAGRRQMLTQRLHLCGGTGEVQFQDVTRLRFDDASLDAIGSFDVLEHVPDYRSAIGEFARVLRPGGLLVSTFPFTDAASTVTRARLDRDGKIEHLLEPEYHGDPIGGGVLCFYQFGWEVLEDFRAAGFSDVRMVMPCNFGQGLFYGLWTLVAKR